MLELSAGDLLLAGLLPLLLAGALSLAGRLMTAADHRREGPATGYAVARDVLQRRGAAQVPVEALGNRADDHFDRRTGRLCLRAEVFHGRSAATTGSAAYAAAWAVDIARSRTLGALDTATASLLLMGGPAAVLCALTGFVFRLNLLMVPSVIALYGLWLLDLVWLPARVVVALRTRATLASMAGDHGAAGLPSGRWYAAQIVAESTRLVQPLLSRFVP